MKNNTKNHEFSSKSQSTEHANRRRWNRFLEAQRQNSPILLYSSCLGAFVGILGGAYRLAIEGIGKVRVFLEIIEVPDWIGWLIPALVSALLVGISVALVRNFAPETSGSGIQQIEGNLDGLLPLRWARVLPVKFFSGLMALGGGLVIGREGPTIHMGGAAGKMVADIFKLDKVSEHVLIAAGAGAGLAAAFNAPFSGILFVVEEMRPQFRYSVLSLQAVVVACATSDIAVRIIAGKSLAINGNPLITPETSTLWLFPVLGVFYGLMGACFNHMLLRTIEGFSHLTGRLKKYSGFWVGGIIGALGWYAPDLIGDGHPLLEKCLTSTIPITSLIGLLLLRFGTTSLSYGVGVPGGIFAPMLVLGTLFGTAFGISIDAAGSSIDPEVFAVAGLGALFAATVRAPLTGIMLAMELTGAFDQVLPLMLTCATATLVAHSLGSPPIYTAMLQQTLKRLRER